MSAKTKFWIKVGLAGALSSIVILAILNRIHFTARLLNTIAGPGA
jgi:hypothetical protein